MKRFLSITLFLTLLLVLLSVPFYGVWAQENGQVPAEPVSAKRETDLLLHIGSPIALSGGKILPIDPNNPHLAPLIHKSRTLAPVRMVAEHFGAAVDYDAGARTALITVGAKTAAFPIGKNYFTWDGKQIPLDTETLLVSGRAFVPLRVICEQILGLQVDYRDSVILIAEKAKLTDDMVETAKSKIGMFVKANSLSALKSAFAGKTPRPPVGLPMTDGGEDAVPAPMLPAATMPPSLPATGGEPESAPDGGTGYSETNIQVEGIDEGDIIKTDGTYIYVAGNNQLRIVKADGGNMTPISSVAAGGYAGEMYIDKNRVIIIGSHESDPVPMIDKTSFSYSSITYVAVYDVSDITNPQQIRYYGIDGDVAAARKKGDYIYLVTNHHTWYRDVDPRPILIENGKGSRLPVSDIMIAPETQCESILTVSAVNFNDAKEPVSNESITGSGYTTYMSHGALYIAMPNYGDNNQLNIARFSIDGSKIGYSGSAAVEGGVNDQFSMDEYEGHLRLATSVRWPDTKNNLYILDENMDVCGSVPGFAPNERIYSARFMGTRGYVVTFRQTDPLFVFDLSDPQKPKITGELKVPGFSNYLHPVSENVLLGFGRDVYDIYRRDGSGKEIVIGQQTGGLKISLFDVSDAGKPREIDTLTLGDEYGYSDFLYNHKAAMFKSDESLLAFPASIGGAEWENTFDGALLISYKDNKLSERGRISGADQGWDSDFSNGDRLVYIGNTLYYKQGRLLRSFDLASLKALQTLDLSK